jgi:hypothetical protein
VLPPAGGAEGEAEVSGLGDLTTADQYESVVIVDTLYKANGGDNKAACSSFTLLLSWGHRFERVR